MLQLAIQLLTLIIALAHPALLLETSVAAYVFEGPTWPTTTLTWSFANPALPGNSVFSGAIGAAYQSIIESALARWESVSDVTFVQVPAGTPGTDFSIGWGSLTSPQVGETDYSYLEGASETFLPGTTIRLEDPSLLPLSAAPAAVYQGTETNLYQLALHEIGHALGLGLTADLDAVMNLYLGYSNPDLDATDVAGVQALYGTPDFAMTDIVTGVATDPQGVAYSGPVNYLQHQFIYAGTDSVAIAATVPNVFIHAAGNDAIAVSSGNNVLDGGPGSNFLVGGAGDDTFFLDPGPGQVTWGTLVNFHPGDAATLWGFTPGVSTYDWDSAAGAPGYTGPTLRAALDGTTVVSSVTFAGLSAAEQAKLVLTTGTSGGRPYLYVTETS